MAADSRLYLHPPCHLPARLVAWFGVNADGHDVVVLACGECETPVIALPSPEGTIVRPDVKVAVTSKGWILVTLAGIAFAVDHDQAAHLIATLTEGVLRAPKVPPAAPKPTGS